MYKKHKKHIISLYRLTDVQYLKVVFFDAVTRDAYLKDGLQILNHTLSGYNNAQTRNFMTITLNSVPIMNADKLRGLIFKTMKDIAPEGAIMHAFHPLWYQTQTF